MSGLLKVLFIADVVGEPGLDILSRLLPSLKRDRAYDLVIANGENGARDARGITPEIAAAYRNCGVDVITGGNHIFDKPELRKDFRNQPNLLRPLNYPPGSGGLGWTVVETARAVKVAVVNLQGRTFMQSIDCPFRTFDNFYERLKEKTPLIIVDIHAESTAEKGAFAWHVDGRASAVIGTHTHVQTADEHILPGGTGFITDAGMTGPFDSVIGTVVKAAVNRFILQTPHPFQVATGNLRLNGVELKLDVESGHCLEIVRLNLP